MIVTFRRGSECSSIQPATAWPASWYATRLRSSYDIIDFLSMPPITRSVASSNYVMPTEGRFFLAAIIAPSLHTFEISAPLNPGVRVASFFAYSCLVCSAFNFIFFKCYLYIAVLSSIFGAVISIYLSNLPGLIKALSRMSALLVAARIMTDWSVVKPSISTKS